MGTTTNLYDILFLWEKLNNELLVIIFFKNKMSTKISLSIARKEKSFNMQHNYFSVM